MSNGMKQGWILAAIFAVVSLAAVGRSTALHDATASQPAQPSISDAVNGAPESDALARHWRYRRYWRRHV